MRAAIVPAELSHVAAIAGDARQADIDELWAYARATPTDCMTLGMRMSLRSWTALYGGVPVAMFGLTPVSMVRGMGTPWMVGTNGLKPVRAQAEILRLSPPYIAEMQRLLPFLFNVVDDRNVQAKRWLVWLGFDLGEITHQGPDAIAFRFFTKGQVSG